MSKTLEALNSIGADEHAPTFFNAGSVNHEARFPTVFDSTMLSVLDSCRKKFYFEHIRRLSSLAISPDLHAGGAFAAGIEVVRRNLYFSGKTLEDSLAEGVREVMRFWGDFTPPHGHVKTMENVIGALYYYFQEAFPPADDPIKPIILPGGQPALEFSFALPTEVQHPDTGEQIMFAGRFDMLGLHSNSILCIVDEKTTKQLGESWSKQWQLRGQFLGYCYAAQQHGIEASTAVVRGIAFLKTKFNHAEVMEMYSKDVVSRWWRRSNDLIAEAAQLWKIGYWRESFGEACTSYGGCGMTSLCLTPNPEAQFSNYQERTWSPLKKDPTEPEGGIKYQDLGSLTELMA